MTDTTILSWISAEVDQALDRVRGQIAAYTAAPQDASVLASCPADLHQVSGALSMVGLSGATRFCDALEKSCPVLGTAGAEKAALIDRAVLQLKEFVEDLVQGRPNATWRLYPAYCELARLAGKNDTSELDLFFPDLTPPAPAHASPRDLQEAELASFLQAQRTRWQRGILAWLKKDQHGLDEMRETLESIQAVAHRLPERRAIWWVAVGLVDALLDAADPAELARARKLWTKIDLYIRDLATGGKPENDELLRELLFAIARSAPLTQRIRDIKLLYGLDNLVPGAAGAPTPDADTLQPVLQEVREKLRKLKKFWRQYLAGEPKTRDVFRERAKTLHAKASPLKNAHFDRLTDAIGKAAERLPDPHPKDSDAMLVEMAAAFLLADAILDTFGNPAPDLEEQVKVLSRWLLDSSAGKSDGSLPKGLRPDLVQEIGAIKVRAQVAKEILVNLQQVEEALDTYARGQGSDKTVQGLGPRLRQIHGALSVLRWEKAVEVLERCEELMGSLRPGSEAMDWVAEGLSAIGFFVTPCLEGREPREQAIATFIERFGGRKTPAVAPVAPQPVPASESNELLDIFLEEAREVLGNIEGALPACRSNPGDRESLATIRRGFHTLKGSGRMVGLTDLGEAAWEMEQVLNRWLEEKQPASPELLDMASRAAEYFAVWVKQLTAGEKPEIDPRVIAELAQRPRPDVFQIYLNEARTHVATLQAESARWCANRGTSASAEFNRAAHTLASSSRTADCETIAEVAGALEHWMPLAGLTVEEADAAVIAGAVAALPGMLAAVAEKKPAPAPAEVMRKLGELVVRLEPAPKPTEKRVMRDDIDNDLLPVFLEEAHELVPQIAGDLRDWKAAPQDMKIAEAIKRGLHTLKGSARMAGAIRLGELTHLMESRIEFALEAGDLSNAVFEDLQAQMDRLSTDLERMQGGPVPVMSAAVPAPARAAAAPEAAAVADAPGAPAAAAAPAPQPAPAAPVQMLRVSADRLDSLINESGEVAIARARIEAELRHVKQSLVEMNDGISRLRAQLREVEVQADSQMQSRRSILEEKELEFDPLEFDRYTRLQELTRMMAEGLNDAASIQQGLVKNLGETDAALLQQARIGRELQQDLMRMRALPFANLSERMHRIVRQTARELGKKAELEIDGAQVELDRSVLERIAAPLEHLLRNALAHGIEDAAARAAAGKNETGRIALALRQEANEILISLTDDGGGINFERLRKKAIEKRLIGKDEAKTEAEQMQLLFLSGLSTAESVTELAGRGVGMDVVKTEIGGIGGRIEVASTRGRGTTFSIYLPLTLAVTQTVLVRAGNMINAILASSVEQVLRIKADALVGLYEKGFIEFQGRHYPINHLRELLGQRAATEIQPSNAVLLLRGGNERAAVHVDELFGNREMVVKNIGVQLSRLPGISGATVTAEGSIVLIVNPVQLASRRRATVARKGMGETTALPTRAVEAPIVMVVDDSITVRKITSKLLERQGYRVVTARDGVDALEQLKDELPAVMLIDIEMPRMDGFDLTRNVRGDPRTMGIPIIVISSRSAPKHRARAQELGVNVYLGKPYEEAELLQQIAAFVPR